MDIALTQQAEVEALKEFVKKLMEKSATDEQARARLTVCASPTHGHLCLPPSLLIFISRGTQHFTWTSP